MELIYKNTDDPTQPEDDTPSIEHVMSRFQSVGDNCELGVVQRYCGVEPRGLFRFSTSTIPDLIAALDDDLRSYGAEDDLEIIPGPGNYYWCRSRRYAFARSTNETIGTIDPAELLDREYGKVAYLKTCLLEELAEGHKIFVRKGSASETHDAFLNLAAAIRRHGPAPVLRVEAAPSPAMVGTVDRIAPGILRGYVRRFSPYEGGMDIDLEPWVDLCRNTHARVADGRPAPAYQAASAAIRLQNRVAPHVTRRSADRFTPFPTRIDPRAVLPDTVTVFSAWIWIPRAFQADRVFGLVKASDVYQRLAHRDADLGLREAWQRIWISARIPPGCVKLVFGVGVTGGPGQRLWSTDWRVGAGPVPPPASPPSVTIRRGILDRFRG